MKKRNTIKMKSIVILLAAVLLAGSAQPVFAKEAESDQIDAAVWERAVETDLPDGTYEIEVQLSGGSGRASVTTPTKMQVQEKKAVVKIEWSSPYYDYMILDGETYLPVNTEGNSVFELPVTAFDREIAVTADTTAMSVPHEIEYTIFLDTASLNKREEKPMEIVAVFYVAGVICVGFAGWIIYKKEKQKKNLLS